MIVRDAITKEKYELDERKEKALREIESAEELHRVVLQEKEQNESKQQELIRLSQSYKHASEEISQKGVYRYIYHYIYYLYVNILYIISIYIYL